MFDLFQDENAARGLLVKGKFQVGVSNADPPQQPIEKGILIPRPSMKEASWVYYECSVECFLDSGIVVHGRLPQIDSTPDTLASYKISDPDTDKITGRGVNTISNDKFLDIVQRMAHSRYWFRLSGQAMRVGEQVPIPGMKTAGGVTAIPHDDNPQWAYNKIVENYSGIILWRAGWSLWYTVAQPPKSQQLPPPNLAAHIAGDTPFPKIGIQSPLSQPDDQAEADVLPVQLQNPLG